jgi:hypothetical protein
VGEPAMEPMQSAAGYVEAPTEWYGVGPAVFLAGGITDCPDWQEAAANWFRRIAPKWTVLNPRRVNFPFLKPCAAQQQIEWEFRHLHRADVVLFWFPAGYFETVVQPIALYELGRYAALGRQLAVGCDPNYVRRIDVLHQLRLARPEVQVHDALALTCEAVLHQAEALVAEAPQKDHP